MQGKVKYTIGQIEHEQIKIRIDKASTDYFYSKDFGDNIIYIEQQNDNGYPVAVIQPSLDFLLSYNLSTEKLTEIVSTINADYKIGKKTYNYAKVNDITNENNCYYLNNLPIEIGSNSTIEFDLDSDGRQGTYTNSIEIHGNGERVAITNLINNHLDELFNDNIELIPFGVENILPYSEYKSHIRNLENLNENDIDYQLEFMPDYILYNKLNHKAYFLEIKASVTPCWDSKRILNHIKHQSQGITIDRIGEIAREPHLVYKRFYPETIVVIGAPYNSKILMAQFAKDIDCLFCVKYCSKNSTNNENNTHCRNNDCPAKTNRYFLTQNAETETVDEPTEEIRATNNGSGTPNTNVDLDSFKDFKTFFDEINIETNSNTIDFIKNQIKDRGVNFPPYCCDDLKYDILYKLKSLHNCSHIELPQILCSNCGNPYTPSFDTYRIKLKCPSCHHEKFLSKYVPIK